MPTIFPTGYAELLARSNFSFLRGASHARELVGEAARLGHGAIGLCDDASLAGMVRAHQAAEEHGLKLLVGARFEAGTAGVALFAIDHAGYRNLSRLVTAARRQAPKGEYQITLEQIADRASGLAAVILPQSGSLAHLRQQGFSPEDAIRQLLPGVINIRDIFGDLCWIAACRHLDGHDLPLLEAQMHLAAAAGLPAVASNDPLYHNRERGPLSDVVSCIRQGVTLREAGPKLAPNHERCLKSERSMASLFGRFADAVPRSMEVADACHFKLSELKYEYPDGLTPPNVSAADHLRDLAQQGMHWRYPDGVPSKVRGLVEHELQLISDLGYEPYFLTINEIVSFARSRGILCQGRGSAANSAVCFCLGLTAVDPAHHDLLFERFISKERAEPPDIDIDFENIRREEVFEHIYQRYGRDRAGLTAVVITYRRRSALREVGKVFGLSADQVGVLSSHVDNIHDPEIAHRRLREAGLDPHDGTLQQVMALSRELRGFPRHLSQHVGGFVLTRGRLDELVPVENAAMDGRTVIQWDKDDLDALGILKVDCLALGMLTCISKCFRMIHSTYARQLDMAAIVAIDSVGQSVEPQALESGDPGTADFQSASDVGEASSLPEVVQSSSLQVLGGGAVPAAFLGSGGFQPSVGGAGFQPSEVARRVDVPIDHGSVATPPSRLPEADSSQGARLCEPPVMNQGLEGRRDAGGERWAGTPTPPGVSAPADCSARVLACMGESEASEVSQGGRDAEGEERTAAPPLSDCSARVLACMGGGAVPATFLGSQPSVGGAGFQPSLGLATPPSRLPEADSSQGARLCEPPEMNQGLEGPRDAEGEERTAAPPLSDCSARVLACMGRGAVPAPSSTADPSTPVHPEEQGQHDTSQGDRRVSKRSPELVEGDERGWMAPSDLRAISAAHERRAVYDMICAGDTLGVFQIESRAQMQMLPRLRPRSFYDLVIEVAIIRPGPIQGGMVHPFLRRRNGLEPVEYPHPCTEPVLRKTLGVPLFQEQVMKLAVVAAGYTPGEADKLRKAMAAWKRNGDLDRHRERLLAGMQSKGISEEFAERLFEQIRGFSSYGFPESHSASFAMIVWVSCWLKRFYPAAFMASLVNAQPMGFYSVSSIIRDAREHGVTILPPDINHSQAESSLEGISPGLPDPADSSTWGHGGPAIRLGLSLVRGLHSDSADAIVAARNTDGPFRSISSLARRTGLEAGQLTRLAEADALSSICPNQREALWQVRAWQELPPLLAGLPDDDDPPAGLPTASPAELLTGDYRTMGLSLRGHPLGLVRQQLSAEGVLTAAQLRNIPDGQPVSVAGMVLCRQRPATASGVVFMTLEDETGVANVVIWSRVFEQHRTTCRLSVMVRVTGRLERDPTGRVMNLIADTIVDLPESLAVAALPSRDFH